MLNVSNAPKISKATRRINAVRFVALVILAGLGSQATAQNPEPAPASRGSRTSGSTSRSAPEGRTCSGVLPSASRAREACEPTKVVVGVEKEVTFSLKLPSPKIVQCAASMEIQYTQRGAKVSVEGTLENKDCAASDGEYKFAVRVRGENGESKTLEFFESWRRQDDQPVKFKGEYPIGENVDILNVRTVQLRCTCSDAPAE